MNNSIEPLLTSFLLQQLDKKIIEKINSPEFDDILDDVYQDVVVDMLLGKHIPAYNESRELVKELIIKRLTDYKFELLKIISDRSSCRYGETHDGV